MPHSDFLSEEAIGVGSDSEGSLPPVVIVGIDDERGVHVARTMARHGIETIGIAKKAKSVGTRTRMCSRILVANTDNGEVIDRLVELGKKLPQKAVLIPCFDTVVSLVSEHRDRLADRYHFVLPPDDTVALMQNKVSFYEFAQLQGFPVPKSFFLRQPADLEDAVGKIGFPCILKPPDSKSPRWLGHTHTKAFQVNDLSELRRLYDSHHAAADVLIVQQMIQGDDSSVHTCYGYYNADSEPLVEFTSRKLRQWPPGAGVGCLAEETRQDTVRDTARRLLKELHFCGLCSLEMKQDSTDGKFYIIEANVCRPTGRCAHVEGCGVEMLLTLYRDAQGLSPPAERQQPFEGRKWMNIRRDTMSALSYWWRRELSLAGWWRSLQGNMSYALFSWRDRGPFLAEITHTMRRALKKLFWR